MGTCPTVVFVARFQLITVCSQRLKVGHRELFCVGRHQLIMNQKKKKNLKEQHTFWQIFCRHRTTQVVKRDRTVMRSSS